MTSGNKLAISRIQLSKQNVFTFLPHDPHKWGKKSHSD